MCLHCSIKLYKQMIVHSDSFLNHCITLREKNRRILHYIDLFILWFLHGLACCLLLFPCDPECVTRNVDVGGRELFSIGAAKYLVPMAWASRNPLQEESEHSTSNSQRSRNRIRHSSTRRSSSSSRPRSRRSVTRSRSPSSLRSTRLR